jgi:HSP20 family molecular chaperone IbpA
VDWEKAEASFEHGVLTLSLPKLESARPRQIPVSTQAAISAPRS